MIRVTPSTTLAPVPTWYTALLEATKLVNEHGKAIPWAVRRAATVAGLRLDFVSWALKALGSSARPWLDLPAK